MSAQSSGVVGSAENMPAKLFLAPVTPRCGYCRGEATIGCERGVPVQEDETKAGRTTNQ